MLLIWGRNLAGTSIPRNCLSVVCVQCQTSRATLGSHSLSHVSYSALIMTSWVPEHPPPRARALPNALYSLSILVLELASLLPVRGLLEPGIATGAAGCLQVPPVSPAKMLRVEDSGYSNRARSENGLISKIIMFKSKMHFPKSPFLS